MTVMTGADALTKSLEEYGTELVVGFIGHSTHEIANAVGRAGIRTVNPATELGGAYMLNAYNHLKGRPAAAGIWHTVGALLPPAAIYEAAAGRIPVVHIGLDIDSRLKGREPIQEIPYESFRGITRLTERVERPDKIPEAVHRAFHAAQGIPAGPVYIDIPFDVTIDEADVSIPHGWVAPRMEALAPARDVEETARELLAARRPVIIAGGGVVIAEAGEEVRRLAELAGVPFITTTTSQGVISEDHPLALGTAGMAGWQCANEALAEADFVLVLGSRLADWGQAQGWMAKLAGRIVQVDSDQSRLGGFYFPARAIVADAKSFADQLTEAVRASEGFEPVRLEESETVRRVGERRDAWRTYVDGEAADDRFPVNPWRIMGEVRQILGPDDIVVSDIGNHAGWVLCGTVLHRPKRLLLSFGAGVLGSAFPMGIGAKLAEPSSNVIVGTGDGAFQYHMNELRVAMAHDLPLVVVVFNNGSYGANHEMMTNAYGGSDWTHFDNPDYAMIARAYGAMGERLERADDVGPALERAVESGKPYVIDVPINREMGWPSNGASGPNLYPARRRYPSDSSGVIAIGERSPTGVAAVPA
jgi:acetolactate synthase I/II/III large subunit